MNRDTGLQWQKITSLGMWGSLLVFGLSLAIFSVFIPKKPASFGELSRLAAVESLVERGTWQITESSLTAKTDDKAFWNGHFYSDKTPLFTALTAVPYWFFYHVFNAEVEADKCNQQDPVCSYWWFTFLLVAVPSAGMLALFYYLGRQLGTSALAVGALTLALGLGTMILPYSVVYNGHVPGASFLFAAFCIILVPKHNLTGYRLVIFAGGLFAGLAFAVDLPSFFLVVALAGWVVAKKRKYWWWFVVGMSLPVLLTLLFNYQIHQSVLPVYFRPGVYNWEGSPWHSGIAGQQRPSPDQWAGQLFNMTLGHHGIFVTWPIIMVPLAGVLNALKRDSVCRRDAIWIAGGCLLLFANALFFTDNFGGRAYGIRYLIALFPLLFYFAHFAIPRFTHRPVKIAFWVLVAVLLAFSGWSTFEGVLNPWGKWTPPVYLKEVPVKPGFHLATRFPQKPRHILQTQFEQGVTLQGVTLTPTNLNPGEKFMLTLFWRPTQIPLNAKVFVHLRDQAGNTVTQADHWIMGYRLSVGEWQDLLAAQSPVADTVILAIPQELAPGRYLIVAGLYNPDTLERLPVINDQTGENAARVDWLTVR